MKRVLKALLKVSLIILLLVFTIILVRAFDARRMPALGVWHRTSLDSEFQAGDYHGNFTFQDYLRIEERLFKELEEEVYHKVEQTGGG